MREPKNKSDLSRWLQKQILCLECLIRYGEPDLTKGNRQFFEEVEVKETMEEVQRVAGRFGYVVDEIPTNPHAALVVCGRLLEEVNGAPDGLLSLREAASLLGYTEKGLRKIVARKGIEFFQSKPWAPIKFKREWIDGFIESHTKKRPVARPKSAPLSYQEF